MLQTSKIAETEKTFQRPILTAQEILHRDSNQLDEGGFFEKLQAKFEKWQEDLWKFQVKLEEEKDKLQKSWQQLFREQKVVKQLHEMHKREIQQKEDDLIKYIENKRKREKELDDEEENVNRCLGQVKPLLGQVGA